MGSVYYVRKVGKPDKHGNSRGAWRYEEQKLGIKITFNEHFANQFKRIYESGITLPIKEFVDRTIELHQESGALQDCPSVSEYAQVLIDAKMKAYVTRTDQPPPELNIVKNGVSRRNHLKNFVEMFGSKRLSEVTHKDILDYYYKRRGQVSNRGGLVSVGTVKVELNAIKSLFNHAAHFGKFDGKNPVNQSGIRIQDSKRERVATEEEMGRLFEFADRQMRDLIVLYAYTGCRRGEILSLEWSWVDLDTNKIHLPAHITKGGKARDAVINPVSHEVLNNRQMLKRVSKFVFPSSKSKSGHLTSPDYAWKNLLAKSGIKNLTLHDLRRTCGTRLAELGVHPEAIQKYLGHADYRTTQKYIHVSDKMTQEAGDILSFTHSGEKSDEKAGFDGT